VDDVKRISKFLISGRGVQFLGKQFLLQVGNVFNETRVYNPLSPIIAASATYNPNRHLDFGNILGSILGVSTSGGSPPAGTLGDALPSFNYGGGKGLLRGETVSSGVFNFQSKWPNSSGGGFGGGLLKQLFGKVIGIFVQTPQRTVTGTLANRRGDESAYGRMLESAGPGVVGRFAHRQSTWFNIGLSQQRWFAGGKVIRKSNPNDNSKLTYLVAAEDGMAFPIKYPYSKLIMGFGRVRVDLRESTDSFNPGIKYGDNVGVKVNPDYEASDQTLVWATWAEYSEKPSFASKFVYPENLKVKEISNTLQSVIDKLNNAKTYSVNPPAESSILMTGKREVIGYDRLFYGKRRGDAELNYNYGVLKEYRENNIRVLENQFSTDVVNRSFKMASSHQFDGLNTLTVLDGDKKINDTLLTNWTEWNPWKDDLIAFYFYDVVNDKYIPFRATIRGLQETVSANWEELSFIGRADRLYSYSGFNRSLTFNFTVVINSIVELSPTWQRINYLVSLTKPASYTRRDAPELANKSGVYTRYMVPPMVMVNVGDLYKNQPVVLASVGITIPDGASWETLNEYNSEEWSYLANYIKAPNVGKKYGQLPRVAELSINCYLLEKERAVAGAAHFGHAPHTETYEKGVFRKTVPDFSEPTELHKSLVVYNTQENLQTPPSNERPEGVSGGS
jgi:hypothetical protein